MRARWQLVKEKIALPPKHAFSYESYPGRINLFSLLSPVESQIAECPA